jgi:hypothetical protein
MNRRAFITTFAAISFAAPAAAAADDPKRIVEQLYKISAGKNGKYEGASAFLKADVQKRWYSKSLNGALAAMARKEKKTGEPILDFDPITNSQDPTVKDLTISVESQTDSVATVAAKFAAEEKSSQIVRYIFRREGGDWKLDDMTATNNGKDEWKLREIIK